MKEINESDYNHFSIYILVVFDNRLFILLIMFVKGKVFVCARFVSVLEYFDNDDEIVLNSDYGLLFE